MYHRYISYQKFYIMQIFYKYDFFLIFRRYRIKTHCLLFVTIFSNDISYSEQLPTLSIFLCLKLNNDVSSCRLAYKWQKMAFFLSVASLSSRWKHSFVSKSSTEKGKTYNDNVTSCFSVLKLEYHWKRVLRLKDGLARGCMYSKLVPNFSFMY